ncbi:MAG TPA: substrate-binding domain-containing protein [Candidatus Dormibacteraeota bacterium]
MVVGLLLGAVACGSSNTGSTGPGTTVDPAKVYADCQSPDTAKATALVDTSKFKKAPPWKIGLAAGYLSNDGWIAYFIQEIKYHASTNPNISKVIVTDAKFNASKQISDIEDLITQGVSAIIYYPVDQTALKTVIDKANAAGIATIESAVGFTDMGTSSVDIDYYTLPVLSDVHLMQSLKGQGKIIQVLPTAGTVAEQREKDALQCVLSHYPNVQLLAAEHGNFNTPDAKKVAQALLQRFPQIDGIASVWGEQDLGIASAFLAADRLKNVTFAPANEPNGWLKWLIDHPDKNNGIVTGPVTLGGLAVQQTVKILNGEQISKGVFQDSKYIEPGQISSIYNAGKSDSYYFNDMPANWQP